MPRQSRIDAPGALHHVIIRGIERKAIVKDDAYLLELTRYIHLNPLRAGMVKDLDALSHAVADYVDLSSERLYTPGRYPVVVHARRILCFLAARERGVTGTKLARQTGLTQPAISMSVNRGERLVNEKNLSVDDFLA